jgi:Tol biopolymer transport system component
MHEPARSMAIAIMLLCAVTLSSSPTARSVPGTTREAGTFTLRSAIAFTSTRDHLAELSTPPTTEELFKAAEIYLMPMNADGSRDLSRTPVRLTYNDDSEGFAAVSPLGKQMVFDSNGARLSSEALQVSDLYAMDIGADEGTHGTDEQTQVHLTRGSSATWSPDGKNVAFHASASGVYTVDNLARSDPGTPALDSDIFVLNVDDCRARAVECLAKEQTGAPGVLPAFMKNVTADKGPASVIDEDPDWSPDGQTIAFTRHDGEAGTYFTANHNNTNAEIWLVKADGTGDPQQVTSNFEEERAPSWSPDGTRILYMCRRSSPPGALSPFQLCVSERDAQGSWQETQLTNDGKAHLTPSWSPDGQYIVFHRPVAGQFQLFRLTFWVDSTGVAHATGEIQLTSPPQDPGLNGFPHWGVIRTRVK